MLRAGDNGSRLRRAFCGTVGVIAKRGVRAGCKPPYLRVFLLRRQFNCGSAGIRGASQQPTVHLQACCSAHALLCLARMRCCCGCVLAVFCSLHSGGRWAAGSLDYFLLLLPLV